MNLLKISAGVLAVILLTGCATNNDPDASPSLTPSSSPTSSSKVITGEPVVDDFIAILNASCKKGKDVGLAAYIPKIKQTTYAFPQSDSLVYGQSWNMMTKTTRGYEISGWFDGDPACLEASYANRVVPKGTPANANGVIFDYKYVEVKPGTVDWSVHRQSQSFDKVRISYANGLVTSIEYLETKYVFEISYGPFSKTINDAYQTALVSSGQQYMYLTPPMFGMTLAKAKAYAKTKGLTVVVGIEDGEEFYPSGPPGGVSDPKRMIVNIMSGEIVGVWTM
jgi:hypothetical protein